MALTVDVHAMHNLAVARCDGLVRENEIHDAIDFSFIFGAVPGGIDRAVRMESTADLRQLDAEALRRIQSHVVEATDAGGSLLPFRSILIAPSPFHWPIAELYKAIWDSHQLSGVEFSVVASGREASRILGLPPLSNPLIRSPAVPAVRGES